jgi:hypothetical protein
LYVLGSELRLRPPYSNPEPAKQIDEKVNKTNAKDLNIPTPLPIAHQLNDVSSSAIDSLWSAAPPSDSAAELSTKAHKPVLKRFDEILGSQAFNNLGLRQPVSQSLTLGISHDGSHFEENGDDIRSRKKKEEVSSYRTS